MTVFVSLWNQINIAEGTNLLILDGGFMFENSCRSKILYRTNSQNSYYQNRALHCPRLKILFSQSFLQALVFAS